MRKKEKDMKFILNFSLAYSNKVKQYKEIVQQLFTMVYTLTGRLLAACFTELKGKRGTDQG